MSEVRDLVATLAPDTVNNLYAQARMFAEKPTPNQKWHVNIVSPLVGHRNFSFDSFDDLRRELSKVASKLTLGSIHVYWGYELPVTTDASGHNLFVTNLEGLEMPITEGYDIRKPINEGHFGVSQQQINIDSLV